MRRSERHDLIRAKFNVQQFAQGLERMASEFPEPGWGAVSSHTLSNGAVIDKQYTWLRHLPEANVGETTMEQACSSETCSRARPSTI